MSNKFTGIEFPKKSIPDYMENWYSQGKDTPSNITEVDVEESTKSEEEGLTDRTRKWLAAKQEEYNEVHDSLYAVDLFNGKNLNDEEKKDLLIRNGYTEELADEIIKNYNVSLAVIRGYYGNGEDRKIALEEAGYDYITIQNMVNRNQVIGVDLVRTKYGYMKYDDLVNKLDSIHNGAVIALSGEETISTLSKQLRCSQYDMIKEIENIISEKTNVLSTVDLKCAKLVFNAVGLADKYGSNSQDIIKTYLDRQNLTPEETQKVYNMYNIYMTLGKSTQADIKNYVLLHSEE